MLTDWQLAGSPAPLQAHWAVVFAHLIIGGTNHGLHGFLVRIRNHEVSAEDCCISCALRQFKAWAR